jgi:ABC-type phosphate transport system substrate-binding protein
MRNVLAVFAVALLTGTTLNSDEHLAFAIIVNKSNQIHDLSSSKVKLIFLRKISRWPWGAEILPVDLPDRNPARRAFVKSIMASTLDQLEVYWIEQKVARGLYPPARVPDVQAAKALVAARAGGVAYIPASDVDDTVRTLEVR